MPVHGRTGHAAIRGCTVSGVWPTTSGFPADLRQVPAAGSPSQRSIRTSSEPSGSPAISVSGPPAGACVAAARRRRSWTSSSPTWVLRAS
ncbi:MAG TPA: hypothetical protein VGO11_08995 [Chthoniobacteraceae bacterium]|nr:hypothetical protein [Chthoniobacteraceae bacterium]